MLFTRRNLSKNNCNTLIAISVLTLSCFTSSSFSKESLMTINKKPKLILQITVDQLRGDLPFRYRDRFVEGGFNYLLNKGYL